MLECALALSVIAGLLFVSLRIMNGGMPGAAVMQTGARETRAMVATTDTPLRPADAVRATRLP